jgi:hypothetical protein
MAEVHDLVYHGNGGFTYHDVYNMPIQYRKYHIKKINEYIEKQNEEIENTRSKTKSPSPSQVARPNVPQADFTTKTKAPKK